MAGVHQFLEAVGTAVRRLRCKGENAVVTPIAGTGKLGDRHQLDCRDAEIVAQIIQKRNDALEGTLRRKGPHMQLVDDEVAQWEVGPILIGPEKPVRVNESGGAMDAIGLSA